MFFFLWAMWSTTILDNLINLMVFSLIKLLLKSFRYRNRSLCLWFGSQCLGLCQVRQLRLCCKAYYNMLITIFNSEGGWRLSFWMEGMVWIYLRIRFYKSRTRSWRVPYFLLNSLFTLKKLVVIKKEIQYFRYVSEWDFSWKKLQQIFFFTTTPFFEVHKNTMPKVLLTINPK